MKNEQEVKAKIAEVEKELKGAQESINTETNIRPLRRRVLILIIIERETALHYLKWVLDHEH